MKSPARSVVFALIVSVHSLYQGVLYCPIKTKSYQDLFSSILGPSACWGRDDEIAETVEAIGRTTGTPYLADLGDYIGKRLRLLENVSIMC
jgi:hypothetical protein